MATAQTTPSSTDVAGPSGENALKTTLTETKGVPEPKAPETAAEAAETDLHEVEVKERKDGKPRKRPVKVERHVVTGGETDPVYLSKAIYKSKTTRKSLTIHHLQRRLEELGYAEAGADIDGYYGDLTASAVANFKAQHNIDPNDGESIDAETFALIFKGDDNVRVSLR
jgi:peptidoglycan hydrolase-like protein with peptidoglycan-binding domain